MDVDEHPVATGRKRKMTDTDNDEGEIDFKRQNTQSKGLLKRKHDDEQQETHPKLNTTNRNRPTLDILRGRRDAFYTQKFKSENAGKARKTRTKRRHKKQNRSSKRRHSKTLSKH